MDAIEFGRNIGALVRDAVAKGLAGLIQRLDAIEQQVRDLPVPQDGKSVTVDELRPVVAEAVKAAVAELPPPKDGASVTVEDVLPPVLEAMHKAVAEIPAPKDGESVTLEQVRPLIEEAVKALPPPDPGKPGDSVTLDQVLPTLQEQVKAHLDALPVPQDGKSVTVAEVVDALLPGVERALDGLHARWALDFERRAQDLFQRALDRIPTPKDGVDGLGFDDISVEHDGERGFTIKFQRGEQVKTFAFTVPSVLDRGFWMDGKSAEPGDGYTHAGSYWIAQKTTTTKPEIGNPDWRLAVRKGRDARSSSVRVD